MASSDGAKEIVKRLHNSRQRQVKVDGLSGSSAMMLLAAIANGKRSCPSMLVVMNDADEAGYAYHDLTQMLDESADERNREETGAQRVLFFPSSYRRAIKYNQKDAANEIQRTETLTRLTDVSSPLVVVTYPDALAERVVSKVELEENTLSVKVGGTFDITELEKQLLELGFDRTDYVYEPGQFAVRGSIVDIYSFSSEQPYRIDFFGDEVDSIRPFDVQTQLSEGKVEQMTVVPAMEKNGTEYISFLEFLPKDTIIVTQGLAFICEKIKQIHDEGFSNQAQFEAETNAEMLVKHFIIDEETFKRQIIGFKQLTIRRNGSAEEDTLHFSTSPQPLFHKNFELVVQEFGRLRNEGYAIYIFADSEKQIARLQNIFEEMAKTEMDTIQFTPVNKAVHEGFIDHDAKRCYFTDHQLFDRFHKYSLKSDKARRGKVALTLKEIQQFEIGDYVVHIDHGVGRFGGLVRVPQGDVMQEMIKLIYKNEDTVYVSIHSLHKVSKYKGKEGEAPTLNRIGGGAWERMKERVKTKVKDIARDLIQLYAARLKEKGFAYTKDGYMQHELEASFTYEDTPDQLKATQDVKTEM